MLFFEDNEKYYDALTINGTRWIPKIILKAFFTSISYILALRQFPFMLCLTGVCYCFSMILQKSKAFWFVMTSAVTIFVRYIWVLHQWAQALLAFLYCLI